MSLSPSLEQKKRGGGGGGSGPRLARIFKKEKKEREGEYVQARSDAMPLGRRQGRLCCVAFFGRSAAASRDSVRVRLAVGMGWESRRRPRFEGRGERGRRKRYK